MVEGITKFTEYFKEYSGSYIIIGGTACDIVTEGAGFDPRATVDIDMVLIIEALDAAFVSRFWEFISEAGYQKKEKDEEKKCCYRFRNRKNESFPKQIELFSRRPDIFTEEQLKHLTPIPVEEGLPLKEIFKVNGYGEEDLTRIFQQFLVNFNLKES